MKEKLKKIIEASLFYPSGDNSQPFKFKITEENQVEIFHLSKRGKHKLNFDNVSSFISLGSVIESIKIAASTFKLEVRSTLKNLINDEGPICIISFKEGEIEEDPLAHFLLERKTDRRKFNGGDLLDLQVQKINSFENISDTQSVKIHFPKSFDSKFKKFIARCETYVFNDLEALWDILHWINFNSKDDILEKQGLPWKNLGLSRLDAFFISLVKKNHFLIHIFHLFGLNISIMLNALKLLNSSAGTILFTVDNFSNESAFELGKVLQRSWTHLCSIGYGVHPVSASCIPYYYLKKCHKLDKSPRIPLKARKFYKEAPEIYRDYFEIDERVPLFMIRVGKTSPLPKEMRIGRLSIDDVLINS